MPESTFERPNRWSALFLAFLFPGLGHLYLKKPRQALLVLLVPTTLLALFFSWSGRFFAGMVLTCVIGLTWGLGAAIHAFRASARSVARQSKWYGSAWFLVLVGGLLNFVTEPLFKEFALPYLRYRAMALPSQSMRPTLMPGDRFILDTGWYRRHALRLGEMVGFESPTDSSVWVLKRCVAIEGEVVEVRDGVLFVNGKQRSEPYLGFRERAGGVEESHWDTAGYLGPLKVPLGSFYCLGDERHNSLDSRIWGPLPTELIRGKALYIWWGKGRAGLGRSLDGDLPEK